MIGVDGLCSVYTPPVSYWCSQHPSKLSTYVFEMNSGIHVFLLHNDVRNHSGWSIYPKQ